MARKTADAPKFSRKQKVVNIADLPGVPAGTVGQVYYEAGLRWFRYHVRFANSVEMSNVDGNALITLEEWLEQQQERKRAELAARRQQQSREAVLVTPGTRH